MPPERRLEMVDATTKGTPVPWAWGAVHGGLTRGQSKPVGPWSLYLVVFPEKPEKGFLKRIPGRML